MKEITLYIDFKIVDFQPLNLSKLDKFYSEVGLFPEVLERNALSLLSIKYLSVKNNFPITYILV